jgi:hypothetical protein
MYDKIGYFISKIDRILTDADIDIAESSSILLTLFFDSLGRIKLSSSDLDRVLKLYVDRYKENENNNWE